MKKIALIFILLAITIPAFGEEWFPKWTKEEIALQGAALALKTVDWRQTVYIAKHPDRYHEINPILGPHPSVGDVDKYFLTTAILQTAIAHVLPHKWRKYWGWTQIGVSGSLVAHNFSVGIGVDF